MSPIRKVASLAAIVLGVLMVLGAGATWFMVSSTLADQRITTPDDAVCLADREVTGPFTAYCQAATIDRNVLEITDGQTYAELDREDERRQTAQSASFLQASLFTSVLAFGVAAMAAGMGVLFVLIGLGMRDVAQRVEPPARTAA
jgi:flagellar basal body-associated protein FliL